MEQIIEHLNLQQIADSGQCFTWECLAENNYSICAYGRYLETKQQGNKFIFSCGKQEFDTFWSGYFDLDTDYGAIKRTIDTQDAYLNAAIQFGGGIRILRQELWEVMVGFLISQNNHIPRIRSSMQALRTQYGQRREKGNAAGVYYSFPHPDELSDATAADFSALGLGYRAKYLETLVSRMRRGGLEELKQTLEALDDAAVIQQLCTLYGIGKKVAECIALFGMHRTNRFPIDTHIRRILERHYAAGFPYTRYDGVLGIIQQYLFYYHLKGEK